MSEMDALSEEELAEKLLEVVKLLGGKGVNACNAAFKLLEDDGGAYVDEFQLNYMTYFDLEGEGGECAQGGG